MVVACIEADKTLSGTLAALEIACGNMTYEILLVHPADSPLPDWIEKRANQHTRIVSAPAQALVPVLWSTGYFVATGDVVAFSTAHCVVGPRWARSLLAAVRGGAAGAGGALALEGRRSGIVDWAVYFLRFSAFMPPVDDGPAHEIPGDNAAYSRKDLALHEASFSHGFWEVDFHRRIRTENKMLVMVSDATAKIARGYRFRTILRHRYLHGQSSGAYRARFGGVPAWRALLVTPLVPMVLAIRILRRVAERRGDLLRAVASLPALLPLGCAWAVGEAKGALRASKAGFDSE